MGSATIIGAFAADWCWRKLIGVTTWRHNFPVTDFFLPIFFYYGGCWSEFCWRNQQALFLATALTRLLYWASWYGYALAKAKLAIERVWFLGVRWVWSLLVWA